MFPFLENLWFEPWIISCFIYNFTEIWIKYFQKIVWVWKCVLHWKLSMMVREKVQIRKIDNATARRVTFSKRRRGLFKKAEELAVLCDADVAIILFSSNDKLFHYSNSRYTILLGLCVCFFMCVSVCFYVYLYVGVHDCLYICFFCSLCCRVCNGFH